MKEVDGMGVKRRCVQHERANCERNQKKTKLEELVCLCPAGAKVFAR